VRHATDLVTVVDDSGRITYHTPSVARTLGYTSAELSRIRFADLLHPDDAPAATGFLLRARRQPGVSLPVEWRVRTKDGRWLDVETIANNLLDDPEVRGLVLTARDIGSRKNIEARLAHQAFHDPLTNLANRALIWDRIRGTYERPAQQFSLLFLDLDNFKTVNDSLGHAVGDELLVAVAERLRSCLRPADTAARLGGDEFAVLLHDATSLDQAIGIAQRIIEELQTPFSLGGKTAFVQTSIGIAMSESARGADELLRNADIAMYRAKTTMKGTCAVFEQAMASAAMERLELESDLRVAVFREELELHYQPIVALDTGRVVGLEALLRWRHPRRGLLLPAAFIGIAEETGLIEPIGRWVVSEATDRLGQLRRGLPLLGPLSISINISSRQLDDPELVVRVSEAIRAARLEPGAVTLEITATAMMRDAEVAGRRLADLKQLGLRLALDDFGIGYSSLHYLHRFPIDLVKVAKPFVDVLGEGSNQAVFTQSIVDLCRTLGLAALAEGIESDRQAHALRALRCELGQGFYLSKPLTGDDVESLLGGGHTIGRYATEVLGRSAVDDGKWWMKVTGQRGRNGAAGSRHRNGG
jgi:diguanylate cyclase (GGDEF)-like protein/PAS domain S-box-containing protein